ncbi:hypothetical protein EST38_g4567 [Candolleomyces aberdarensis]|uniref:Alpha-ketoglutarate-dependent dioxygenase AlkB-like domain-containing protein n=1 Tax=Candolleomyces aberdarensis TaxID=2316362 RepID=A0A4Q2DPI3_9AGAR|nr:hypothetical protein EST38_g4567 [Candolleomyces aberdarensis]
MGDTVGTASTLFSEEEKTELLEDGPKKLGPPRDERQPSESSPKFSENMVTLILPTEWDLPVNLAPSLNDAGLANKVSNEVKTARPQPLDLDLDLDLDLEAMQMVKPEDLELVVIPSAHEHRRPPMAGATVAPAIVPENIAPEPDLPPFRPLIPLNTYPPIWAQTRQEVCETFEWFRSYQGGVYFNNDIAKGYLLSAFGARRDAFKHDGRLIISHGGGRAASIHSEKGQSSLRPAEDQKSDDKSVRALLKACREKRPIALVIDDRYALFPYDLSALGVTYAVLGFYMIVEAWEKLISDEAEYETDRTGARSVVKYKFAFQWCERQGEPWWLSQSGKAEELDLDEDAPPVKVGEVDDLREEEDSDPTDVTSTECDQCGKGSPQVYSEGWWMASFYLIIGNGCLYQIQPSSRRAKLEADNIFKTYQEEANSGQLVFKRWPLRAVAERFSPTISRTMLENLTMSYVGGTDNTVPFDKAPSAVVMSRKLIQDRISQALDRDTEFNEVLTAAYMEKQKMAFHSDEEVGLGPLVAGLSLGSPAMMHFRLQKKHDKERQQRGILMSFTLRHGDVFVMDGLDVQKYYEHTVVPTNFRIAATARSINASTAATPTEPALSGPHKSHT